MLSESIIKAKFLNSKDEANTTLNKLCFDYTCNEEEQSRCISKQKA